MTFWQRLLQAFREPPKLQDGSLELSDSGFILTLRGERTAVDWSEVEEIWAFKRDLFTVDQICLQFKLTERPPVLVTEDDEGFSALEDALQKLPLAESKWREKVTFPAFAENQMRIY
jgi:hypothetical protein